MIVLDTNVLVYAVNAGDPHHAPSRAVLEAVAWGTVPACMFPQMLLEFYSVVTNPQRISAPLSAEQATAEIANLRAFLPVVNPREGSLDRLVELVLAAGATRADVFDAFIVAQMKDAGIETICTYNLRDFADYPVEAEPPEKILDSLGISRDGSGLVHDRPVTGRG